MLPPTQNNRKKILEYKTRAYIVVQNETNRSLNRLKPMVGNARIFAVRMSSFAAPSGQQSVLLHGRCASVPLLLD
ncbi:hypothetical protein RHGRI_010344 [Rhododendron griersonianum]|uniref:Uncharacterized protein n=1 Tax=Rhododendron griersonianum TaxID=479676 RepID=A0AAV6KIV9_9ERIC|nr:hypothetical protein RHGRI_010344 [Rhododendron griersonianum]